MIRSIVFDEHFDQPVLDPAGWTTWCPDLHTTPLRVSAVQSGNRSGPVGSSRGQQPFRDGLVVREEQPTVLGFTPHHGRVEVTCSARIQPWSMFSAWMVGIEDEPDRCGEICLVEFFVDDERTRVCTQAPDYPLQLILGVFDFPDRRPAGEVAVAELVVHRVRGTR